MGKTNDSIADFLELGAKYELILAGLFEDLQKLEVRANEMSVACDEKISELTIRIDSLQKDLECRLAEDDETAVRRSAAMKEFEVRWRFALSVGSFLLSVIAVVLALSL